MRQDCFIVAMKQILQMASTDFLRVVNEIGYMENPYTSKQLLSLDHSIDIVTRDLAEEVFGESNTIKK